MNAMTGSRFSPASARMRPAIKADCTGEPPGLLIVSATALAPRTLNARSSAGLRLWSDRPRPRNGAPPITPDSLTTGTTGPRRRNAGHHRQCQGLSRGIVAPLGQVEGDAITEHAFRYRGEAAVRAVQNQTRGEPQRSSSAFAGLDQHALGRPA